MDWKALWDVANAVTALAIAQNLAFLYAMADGSKMARFVEYRTTIFWGTIAGSLVVCSIIVLCHLGITWHLDTKGDNHRIYVWATAIRLLVVSSYGFGGSAFFLYGVRRFVERTGTPAIPPKRRA